MARVGPFELGLRLPAVRHSVAAQSPQIGPTQLHRMVAKDIGQQLIGLLLLP
jgi:hypothetical protein